MPSLKNQVQKRYPNVNAWPVAGGWQIMGMPAVDIINEQKITHPAITLSFGATPEEAWKNSYESLPDEDKTLATELESAVTVVPSALTMLTQVCEKYEILRLAYDSLVQQIATIVSSANNLVIDPALVLANVRGVKPKDAVSEQLYLLTDTQRQELFMAVIKIATATIQMKINEIV